MGTEYQTPFIGDPQFIPYEGISREFTVQVNTLGREGQKYHHPTALSDPPPRTGGFISISLN